MMLWIAALEYNASNLQELSKIWFLVVFFCRKEHRDFSGGLCLGTFNAPIKLLGAQCCSQKP